MSGCGQFRPASREVVSALRTKRTRCHSCGLRVVGSTTVGATAYCLDVADFYESHGSGGGCMEEGDGGVVYFCDRDCAVRGAETAADNLMERSPPDKDDENIKVLRKQKSAKAAAIAENRRRARAGV